MGRVPFNYTWIEGGKILAGSIPQMPEDLEVLRSLGIKTILSLTRRDIGTYPGMAMQWFSRAKYPIPDAGVAAGSFMLEAAAYIDHAVKRGEPIYVHCRGGIGRTGMILLAYYVLHRGLSLAEAKEIVKVRRNFEGNASAIDQGSPQKEWIDTLEKGGNQAAFLFEEGKSMRFETTLELIGQRFGFEPAALRSFAEEDNIGGWDQGAGSWPIGSLWSVEGKTLYALVRALRPDRVVEIGTWRGASATHIASALKVNGHGKLICLDDGREGGEIGNLIPDDVREYIEFVQSDGTEWLPNMDDNSIGLIYEDADHSSDTTQAVAEFARAKLVPGGVLAVHDAAHFLVGAAIRTGLDRTGLEYGVYLAEPSDCGLGLWRKPMEAKADEQGDAAAAAAAQTTESAPPASDPEPAPETPAPPPQAKPAPKAKGTPRAKPTPKAH